ncbi:MAG: hypothetical protein ACD_46C00032G0004 [uncultured bacterium]|nr:MAG: hypothetical protein ACD_46C00032G0004 [uncultured bacterium]
MKVNQKRFVLSSLFFIGLPLAYGPAVLAAKPVDLSHQNISILQSFTSPGLAAGKTNVEEINRSVDFNQTLHIRVQQTYAGFPIWGGDAIVHIPHGATLQNAKSLKSALMGAKDSSMTGTFYQDLQSDLANTPSSALTKAQAQKALNHVVGNYQQKIGVKVSVKDQQTSLIVFIDKFNKAHWAYQVSFYMDPIKQGAIPSKPVAIVDAQTFQVYAEWNDIQTLDDNASDVFGGGFGGNKKMGKISYDGLPGDLHLDKFKITRDDQKKSCLMKNADVTVKNYRNGGNVMSFACDAVDPNHNNIYWSGDVDAVNDGYSPMDDAMLDGVVLKGMYQDWYGVPVLTENGKPMMLNMVVHAQMDNAYWDGRQMTFGDGINMFYPLTSLGVGAHEVSHGFTQQHSNLAYYSQSGGMNEAFSDMAAQGAEVYAYNKNSWQIGPEIFKKEGQALRYMDQPSKDCRGKSPGDWCSIDTTDQYYEGLDVHFSSGIFNRAFYLIAKGFGGGSETIPTTATKKAFDVMVKANQNYWTKNVTFAQGACGVIKATNDYAAKDPSYDVNVVKTAFKTVGVDTSKC